MGAFYYVKEIQNNVRPFERYTLRTLKVDNINTEENEKVILGKVISFPGIYAMASISFIGIILNMVVIFTNFRKRGRSTHALLIRLATVDLLNCVIMSTNIPAMLHILTETQEKIVCTLHSYVFYSCDMISALIVVCIACDRYAKVAKPHQASRKYVSTIYMIVLFSFILSFPFLLLRAFGFKAICLNEIDYKGESEETRGMNTTSIKDIVEADVNLHFVFSLTFYGSLLTVLLIAFIVIVLLYVKLAKMVHVKNKLMSVASTIILSKPADDSVCTSSAVSDDFDTGSNSREHTIPTRHHTTRLSVLQTIPVDFTSRLSQILSEKSRKISKKNHKQKITIHVQESVQMPCRNKTIKAILESNTSTKRSENRNSKTMESKSTDIYVSRRKASSVSMASRQRPKTQNRTFCMLSLSILLFMLHFPYLCLIIINILKPLLTTNMPSWCRYVYTTIEHSYVLSYILDPILYSFFNRGFLSELRRLLQCFSRGSFIRKFSFLSRVQGRRPQSNSSTLGKSKCCSRSMSIKTISGVQTYPYLSELQRRFETV